MKPNGSARAWLLLVATFLALMPVSVANGRNERQRINPLATSSVSARPEAARSVELSLSDKDVIPTGNDWIALPSIRASDGALQNFNAISMRYRGLIEVAGLGDRPLMAPFLMIAGERRPLAHLHWSLRDYWIPVGDDGSRRGARHPDLCRTAQ